MATRRGRKFSHPEGRTRCWPVRRRIRSTRARWTFVLTIQWSQEMSNYYQRPGLREPQMMRIGGLPAANQTGLRGHEPQIGFVTQPFGLGDGEKALIDLRRDKAG
jgi:hypothetical protein